MKRSRSPVTAPLDPDIMHVMCDKCGSDPIIGIFFRCSACNYDVCQTCGGSECPDGHTLARSVMPSVDQVLFHSCDICADGLPIRGPHSYQCVTCNFDVCNRCMERARKTGFTPPLHPHPLIKTVAPTPYHAVLTYPSKTIHHEKVDFSLTADYEMMNQIGSGGYGIVSSARHVKTGDYVAVKQTLLPLGPDFELIAARTLREIRILKFLARHSPDTNFIVIRDILQMRSRDVGVVSTVCQLIRTDLRAEMRYVALDNAAVKIIMHQLLRSFCFLHSAGIAHRDIKPENILIDDTTCRVCVCDFGLAREMVKECDMSTYVETRWYRAPELLMGLAHYDATVDMWSLGCVMAEMLTAAPHRTLWRGKDALHQMELIRATSQLSICFPPTTDPHALDVLSRMLIVDPSERWSATRCLAHPYFDELRKEHSVMMCSELFEDRTMDFVNDDLVPWQSRVKKLKEMLYEEMLEFHPELRLKK